MSRCILLLNAGSGGNDRGLDAQSVCAVVEEFFREAGHDIESMVVAPDAIESGLARAVSRKPDIVLVAGGDGTVSAAAKCLGGSSIAMGILPMGTFNLAARDLGIPLEIEDAAKFLAEAPHATVDVLEVAGHTCLCTTILGFYPEFAEIFEQRDHGGRWWVKAFKVFGALRRTFTQARPLNLTWQWEGGSGHARTKFAAFVPGRYEQSAGLIPARTDFRSGHLTGYIGTQSDPGAALRGIFDYALGRQEQNPEIRVISSAEIKLKARGRKYCNAMIDGEILRLKFPITMRIRPKHLQVLTSKPEVIDMP